MSRHAPGCGHVKSHTVKMAAGSVPLEVRHLLPPHLGDVVKDWLKEDIPSFDYAGAVVGTKTEEAVLLCKSDGVLCGAPFFDAVFAELGCTVSWSARDGDAVRSKAEVARVTGPVNKLLQGERTALNVVARASGIATHARELREAVSAAGWTGEVAGTRKTTPGFRLVEKYALLVGGISTHRHDLSSMIMLKDNHIWSTGSIGEAVRRAQQVGGFSLKIEVECRSIAEAKEAAEGGADVVMLDNFEHEALAIVSRQLKSLFPNLIVEASGGIRRENIVNYCLPTVDVISLSTTTQGYAPVNFSLKVLKEGHNPSNPKVTRTDL